MKGNNISQLVTKRYVKLTYKNWKGEVKEYRILPQEVWYGSTEWHREPQWFLKAYLVDTLEQRDFAMKDIITWEPHQS